MLGLLAPLTANAAPANVPLSTLDIPPQNGRLSNGVKWSVVTDPGPQRGGPAGWVDGTSAAIGFYRWNPEDGDQIWTFSVPVNLSFSFTNFQGGPNTTSGNPPTRNTEGVVLPAGTVCDVSGLDPLLEFIFDPTGADTRLESPTGLPTLWHNGPTQNNYGSDAANAIIPCTLNNVTELRLNGEGFSPTYTRGLHSLTVNPVASPFNVSTTSVPVLNPVSLALLALALGGLAFWRRRQIS